MTTVRYGLKAPLLWVSLAMLMGAAMAVRAQSCQMTGDLDDASRAAITAAGQRYFEMSAKGDAASLRQNAIASLASDFSGIEAAVKDRQPDLSAAQPAVRSIFLLEAEGKDPIPHEEFLCGVFGKNGQTSGSAAFYFDNLPPGKYAIALLDAKSPTLRTSFSVILQQVGTDWKLAGLDVAPTQIAGHDGDWFAAHARDYKTRGQLHNAWFYYLEARKLIVPLSFMSTMATDRLYDEFQSVQPTDIPIGGKTADLAAGTATYKLTALFPTAVGNDLDRPVSCDRVGSLRHTLPKIGIVAKEDARATPFQRLEPIERRKHRLAVMHVSRQAPLAQCLAEIARISREHDITALEAQPQRLVPRRVAVRRQAHHGAVAEHVVLAINQA